MPQFMNISKASSKFWRDLKNIHVQVETIKKFDSVVPRLSSYFSKYFCFLNIVMSGDVSIKAFISFQFLQYQFAQVKETRDKILFRHPVMNNQFGNDHLVFCCFFSIQQICSVDHLKNQILHKNKVSYLHRYI